MPQLTQVVLKDGLATPANHTFAPADITAGVATLIESTGVPIGDKRLTMSLATVKGSGRRKATIKLTLPVVQDQIINGVSKPTVVRTAFADVTMTFDPSSNVQERKDLLAMLASLLGDAFTKTVVGDLQGIY